MKKHALTCAFLSFFTHFAYAQLTLQRVDGNKKHVIPIGTLIDLTFPTKTKEKPEDAFQLYGGKLKKGHSTGVDIVLTFKQHYFVNENGTTVRDVERIRPSDTPAILQIPLTKMRAIVVYTSQKKVDIRDAGAYLFFAAIVSNLFVAPHLGEQQSKMVRNAGFIAMGLGLTVGLLPHRKTYYLEQPQGGNKKLWKIVSN